MSASLKSLALAVSLAFSASALAFEPPVFLPVVTKDQTGFYSIQLDDPTSTDAFEKFSAVAVEIYDPGERLLLDGTRVNLWTVHAALYTNDSSFVVLTGFTDSANPTTVDVEVYSTVGGETVELGVGQLRFDPESDGRADIIEFDIELTAEVEGLGESEQFALFGQRSLSGKFRRNSDRQIFGCQEQVSFSPEPPLTTPTAWCQS